MNENNKTQGAETPSEEMSLSDLAALWKKYGAAALTIVLVAAAILLGGHAFFSHKTQRKALAQQILFSAQSPQQLEELIRDDASAPAAPLALLALASTHFNAGNYGQARLLYEEFLEKYGGHELRNAAELGRYFCMEAEGRLNEALVGFSGYALAHPQDFLAPQAVLGQGRCLQELGRLDEARIAYENFIAAAQKSEWTTQIESALAQVKLKLKNPGRPPAQTPAAPAPAPAPQQPEAQPAEPAPADAAGTEAATE